MAFKVGISPARGQKAKCRKEGCEEDGGKIARGQLRLAEAIHYPGKLYTGWGWRHWGCVSPEQIQIIRAAIRKSDGEYDWDNIDGYNTIGRYQAKVRRVITQGYIDPEDIIDDLERKVLRGIMKTPDSDPKFEKSINGEETPKLKTKPCQPGTPYGIR